MACWSSTVWLAVYADAFASLGGSRARQNGLGMTNSTNDDRRFADLTREALADVSAGLVIDHELVEIWAQSLDTDTSVSLPTPDRPT